MKPILDVIGFIFALASFVVVFKTMKVWRGVLRDGLLLFSLGFIFMGFGFIWDTFFLSQYIPISNQAIFALGMMLLFGGSYKIFTFIYP